MGSESAAARIARDGSGPGATRSLISTYAAPPAHARARSTSEWTSRSVSGVSDAVVTCRAVRCARPPRGRSADAQVRIARRGTRSTAPVSEGSRGSPGTKSLRAARPAHIYNHMVARGRLTEAELDRLFRALADATRRDIVARVLSGEPASISALAARYDMSFAAVQKHVAVLEGAKLVAKQTQGRERIVRGNPERIAQARELLTQLEDLWRDRFSQSDALFSDP